jgi:hypothetical protein
VAKTVGRIPIDIRSHARRHCPRAIERLADILESRDEMAVARAASTLLDRGYGKAPQPVTGKDGTDDIRVTIRTILEGKK